MLYRPEYHLQELRQQGRTGSISLTLRWLRTIVFDATEEEDQKEIAQLTSPTLQEPVWVAHQQIVVKLIPSTSQVAALYLNSMPMLTALDLRGCVVQKLTSLLVSTAATKHASTLRRLLLPPRTPIPQELLNAFGQLEELDITSSPTFAHMLFCSATLQILYADNCQKLTDKGLERACNLKVLHVSDCHLVTTVAPFAHSLRVLSINNDCGIGSDALSEARCLMVLHAARNTKVHHLFSSATNRVHPLRELDAAGDHSAITDDVLRETTALVKFSCIKNTHVTTVAPFGLSLLELDVGHSAVGDSGLVTATGLVHFSASNNPAVCNLSPFASTLLELATGGDETGLTDIALHEAIHLISLTLYPTIGAKITTVAPFAASLRHLEAAWNYSLTDASLAPATKLVTLNCSEARRITSLQPFANSLLELTAYGNKCGVKGEEVSTARRLQVVKRGDAYPFLPNDQIKPAVHLKEFCKRPDENWARRYQKN